VGDSTTPQQDASTDATAQDAPVDQATPTDGSTDAPVDAQEAGPFDANYYGNVELWLRADVGTTGDGGGVATWTDSSSKHRTVSLPQSDPNCQEAPALVASAIHGLPAVQFDGAFNCLTVSGSFTDFSLGFTGFVVFQPNTCNSSFTGNSGALFDSSQEMNFQYSDAIAIGRNWDESANTASGDAELFSGTGAVGITGGGSWVPGTADLVEFRLPAASGGSLVGGTAFVNGTFQNNLNPNGPTIPYYNGNRTTTYIGYHASETTGDHQLYCGMIGEMIIFSKGLNDGDRQAVESYLKTRWQL